MFSHVAANLPSDICHEFRLALACGHWRSGQILTEKQKRTCMEALFFHEGNADDATH